MREENIRKLSTAGIALVLILNAVGGLHIAGLIDLSPESSDHPTVGFAGMIPGSSSGFSLIGRAFMESEGL